MRIGIDLGGTKIEGILLAPDGREQARFRVPTPRDDYGATLDAVAQVVADLDAAAGRKATVGIGMPGTLSRATGLIKNANSTWLNGTALDQDLAQRLDRPVRLMNDANCFALSEAMDGAAAGAGIVFGIIAGTGLGGGLVVNGRIVDGPNGITGEWGHNPLPLASGSEWPGPACYCGRRGCNETWLSGPGLAADYGRASGTTATALEIAARAAAGDPHAQAALDRHADRFARALAAVINIIDPDVVVLGGGLSNLDHLIPAIKARWARHIFSDRTDTRLVRNQHGDSSGVRGAAWLWPLAP